MFKQLHYFKSWLLLMLCTFVGASSAWAQSDYSATYTSNVTLSTAGGTTASACKVVINETQYDGIKIGTGSAAGAMQIAIPEGTKYLHMHISGWKGVTGLSLNVTGIDPAPDAISVTADDGVNNNSPFTLQEDPSTNDFYKVITFSSPLENETTLTFTTSGKKRCVIYGVNAEEESDPSDTRADADLSFSSATASATIGQDFTAPTLSAATGFNGTVDYESSNEDVAQIYNQETGELRIVGEGTTTITATFAGNDDFKAGSASYTLTVTDNRIATTITYDNITLDVTEVATLTQLSPVVKDADNNIIAYTYEEFPPTVSFTIESDENGIIGSLDNNSGEITLNATEGTATLKAYYNLYGVSDTYKPSQCTFTITVEDMNAPGKVNNPYTVAQALAADPANGVYVQGTISAITEVSTQYKNATYTISDGTNEMLIYRGRYLDNADFTSADQIQLGDVVKVYGNLAVHNNANQMAQGNYIVNLTRKPTATLAFEQDSYEVAILGALTITATSSDSDGAITYESSDEDIAVIDETTGEVTATSAGVITITARIADTDSYKGTTATVQLTVIDPRQEVTLSFPTTPATINIGQEATYAVTSTPEGLEDLVAYTSSDDDIVSVDLGTGEITANAVGTATITATFEGDSEYMAATAFYTITVVDPSAPVHVTQWVEVDPATLTTGDVVVIVDKTSSKAMANNKGTSAAPTATDVTLNAAKTAISSEVDATIQWTVTVSGTDEKSYQFGVGNDFLYVTKTNNGVRVGDGTRNSFTIATGGDNSGYYLYNGENEDDRNVGCYNSSDWRCYGTINSNIKGNDNAFYKKVEEDCIPVTITSAGAASFSSKYALDFSKVSELTAYKATSKSDSYVHLDEVEQVPAGAGVIVKGAEGLYYVPVVTGDVAELEGNLLVGTGENTFTVTSAEYGKVFKYAKRTSDGVVGFQKAKEGWTCQAGHAYLMLSETQAREFIGIFGEDISTGINSIDNSQLTIDNDAPAYNLAGQKVGKGYKGIVVKNGKKYVK